MEDDKPWLLVRDPAYFRGVLGSMVAFDRNARHDSSIVVRFGLTGDGVRPNYQVESPGRSAAKRGDSHAPDKQAFAASYADHDISAEHFALADVTALLERCLRIQAGSLCPEPVTSDGTGS